MLKKILLKRLLNRANKKLAPRIIPMSRPKSLERNYYSIEFTGENQKYFIFNEIYDETVKLSKPNTDGSIDDIEIMLDDLLDLNFKGSYYLKDYEFPSTSITNFEILNTLKIYNLTASIDKYQQWRYNKRSIAQLDRFKILKYLVEETIKNPDTKFNVIAVIGDIFDFRILLHPSYKARKRYYDLIFKSLADEGLISYENLNYTLNAKALTALNNYEQELRRYKYSIFLQWVLSIITLLSVVGIFIQAYIAYSSPK
ncbi:MAG: hypothetical protein ACOH2S_11915 [Janthinobacterium svalbardensis]